MSKIDRLQVPTTEKTFKRQRTLARYIGVNFQPYICASVQFIAPKRYDIGKGQFHSLQKSIHHFKRTKDQGLSFVKTDLKTLHVVIISDAAIANARELRSRLGFVVSMAGDECRANIVHYGSKLCHRVSRSVTTAEVHAPVHGFDVAFFIRQTHAELLCREKDLEAYIDSKTLFRMVAKDENTAERRFQIDVFVLKESYRKRN